MDRSTIKFWNKTAEKYSKQPISDEETYQKKLQITREYFKPDMVILEFGCGTGSTAILHAPHVKHIHAIDISSEMIKIAQEKANAQSITNITFECATLDELEIPDQSLDMVLGLSVIHLLENKDDAIQKVFKALKPGGVFVSSTVCLGEKMKIFKIIAPIGKFFGLMPLVKVFTAKELEKSLTTAGFEIEYNWRPKEGESFFSGMSVFIVAKKNFKT